MSIKYSAVILQERQSQCLRRKSCLAKIVFWFDGLFLFGWGLFGLFVFYYWVQGRENRPRFQLLARAANVVLLWIVWINGCKFVVPGVISIISFKLRGFIGVVILLSSCLRQFAILCFCLQLPFHLPLLSLFFYSLIFLPPPAVLHPSGGL